MYKAQNLNRLCREISKKLEDEFSRVGFFFRIFDRVKSTSSIDSKIVSKGTDYYDGKIKFIRDIIGIRIVPYFPDDIEIIQNRINNMFNIVEQTIDKTGESNFHPIRINLICQLPNEYVTEFKDLTQNPMLDSTFEVQLRTILSEGWHEVDHDLRYKCQNDWSDSSDLARNFNGILATLETSEYAIQRVFDQLCYRHYKSKDLIAMIRTKFRLRLVNFFLSKELNDVFQENIDLVKDFYKVDRNDVIHFLLENNNIIIPMTLENFIFIINFQFIKNKKITDLTPNLIINELLQS